MDTIYPQLLFVLALAFVVGAYYMGWQGGHEDGHAEGAAGFERRIQLDPNVAWSWHCSLAMGLQDVREAELTREEADWLAAELMMQLFSVDPRELPQWAMCNLPTYWQPTVAGDPVRHTAFGWWLWNAGMTTARGPYGSERQARSAQVQA